MEFIIVLAIIACIPAAIASNKGRSFGLWWLYGVLLWIVALIHSLCLKKNPDAFEIQASSEGVVKCPFCAEMIKAEACKCKHCGSDVMPQTKTELLKPSDDGIDYLVPGRDGAELDVEALRRLAAYLLTEMPESSVPKIMIANAPLIARIKNSLPGACASRFENALEHELKSQV